MVIDKRAQKLCARLDMTLRVGILDLREFQTGELDFVLRLLDGILFALDSLEQLLFGLAPHGAQAGQ